MRLTLPAAVCWPIAILGLIALLGSSRTAGGKQAAPADHTMAEKRRLPYATLADSTYWQTGGEARDEQPLISLKRLASHDGDRRNLQRLSSTLFAELGTVEPAVDIADHTEEEYDDAEPLGIAVTKFTLTSVTSPSSFPAGTHVLVLHFDGTTWYGTIDNDLANRLPVMRYTYGAKNGNASLDRDEDYPATARWDWAEPNAQHEEKAVVGVPCGHGWCLVGVDATYAGEKADPLDRWPKVGQIDAPVTRRVRGWHDRKPNPSGPGWSYIYPERKLRRLARKDFRVFNTGNPARVTVATIVRDNTSGADSVKIRLFDEYSELRRWTAKIGGNATLRDMTRDDRPGHTMPGAARWGRTLNGLIPLVPAPLFAYGEIWVRCASGCCSANLQ